MTHSPIFAHVRKINELAPSIYQIFLSPEVYIDYEAGQYLEILIENEIFSYSIANAPSLSKDYELHIRYNEENPFLIKLFEKIRQNEALTIRLPFGRCSFREIDRKKPILLVAGGTGFAPIKAMLEQYIINKDPRKFELYWGAKIESDLYFKKEVKNWQRQIKLEVFYSLSDKHRDHLSQLILHEHQRDLNDLEIIISGPFNMVYDTRDKLIANGANPKALHSDAFEFETK